MIGIQINVVNSDFVILQNKAKTYYCLAPIKGKAFVKKSKKLEMI